MWTIEPGIGIGPIRLGMKEEEYIELLGDSYRIFNEIEGCDVTLSYVNIAVKLSVDSEKRISGISVCPPIEVFWKDIQLLGLDFKVVREELNSIGLKIKPIDVGIWVEDLKVYLIEVEDKVAGIEMEVIS